MTNDFKKPYLRCINRDTSIDHVQITYAKTINSFLASTRFSQVNGSFFDQNLLIDYDLYLCVVRYSLVRFLSSHYDVLGVGKLASKKEIKIAYYKKCKEIHPDKNNNNPKSHQQFVKINEAYSILSDPISRREYDESKIIIIR